MQLRSPVSGVTARALLGTFVITLAACGGGSGGGSHTPVWGTPAQVTTFTLGMDNLHLAADAAGNTTAVYSRQGKPWAVQAVRIDASGTPGAVETLSDGINNAYVPNVAVDANDSAMAVWQQWDGTRDRVWASRRASGAWGPPQLIDYADQSDASSPTVAFDTLGNAMAVWTKNDGTTTNIIANYFKPDGTGWRGPQVVDVGSAGADAAKVIFVGGVAMAVWRQSDGTNQFIWSSRFDATGGTWSAPQKAEQQAVDASFKIEWRSFGRADGMLAWTAIDGSLWANRYSANTGWGSEQKLADGADDPSLATSSAGSAVLVFQQTGAPRATINAARYNGSAWGAAAVIDLATADTPMTPQVTMDAHNNAVAVWVQSYLGLDAIVTNRYSASGGWGTAQVLGSDATYPCTAPAVAGAANGDAVALWSIPGGTPSLWWSALR